MARAVQTERSLSMSGIMSAHTVPRLGMIVRGIGTTVLLLAGWVLPGPVGPQPEAQAQSAQAVQGAAQKWLEEVDTQEFEEAWEEAAPSFRKRLDRTTWIQGSTRLADSLGRPSTRTLTDVQRRDSLRQAAGPFVVLTYRARLANTSLEELLVMDLHDDEWRVAGYRVAPLSPDAPPIPHSEDISLDN